MILVREDQICDVAHESLFVNLEENSNKGVIRLFRTMRHYFIVSAET